MTLKEMPKVGDVILAKEIARESVNQDLTMGKEYVIHRIDNEGDANFYDDEGYEDFISEEEYSYYTLKTTPSVADILANLALRVSELERHNREQAYEINELYKAVSAND